MRGVDPQIYVSASQCLACLSKEIRELPHIRTFVWNLQKIEQLTTPKSAAASNLRSKWLLDLEIPRHRDLQKSLANEAACC